MIYEKLPISVLIMCQNEEANIRHTIESVKDRFNQVVVTDSFSTDKTAEICKSYSEIEFYEHVFEGWAEQRNWMLQNCNIKNEIIFFLDADEWIDELFYAELKKIIEKKIEFDAIYLSPKFIFLGAWLKYSYGHPKIRRIFKKEGLYFEGEGAREYAHISGTNYIEMKTMFYHDDRRGIDFWIRKHLNNAQRESDLYLSQKESVIDMLNLSVKLKIKLWIRKNIWDKLPLTLKPFIYFFVRYILQRGFLDGKAGFLYCFLHAFWYQMMINIKIIEGRKNE